MPADRPALPAVLATTRALPARPGNDFAWSSFQDAAGALAELDTLTAAVRAGTVPSALHTLFAPAGPIQEVALSSGWGGEFLTPADRFDALAYAAGASGPPAPAGRRGRTVGARHRTAGGVLFIVESALLIDQGVSRR